MGHEKTGVKRQGDGSFVLAGAGSLAHMIWHK